MSEIALASSIVVDLNEKIRVLHVDDDSASLNITKRCLEIEAPLEIDTAMSVDEALAKLEKEKYDVVVSDYQMPIKDGLEFLKELREKGNKIPFIVFTGKGREEVAIRALNLGADQYLNKTGDPETVYCELAHAILGVAERKRAQEGKTYAETALKKVGEKYEHLFNSALDGILINEPDGTISSLNPTAARMLGYGSPEELIGKPAVELFADPEVRSRVLKELIVKESLRDCELLWKKKDGTLIEVLVNITVEKDEKGNLLRTEGIFREVTDKEKAERSLAESEQKLRAVVHGSPIPTFYIDKYHKVVYWNGALEKYSGIKGEDVIGTDRHWMAFYQEKRPCMADLVLDEDPERIASLYSGKYRKSELVEGGYEATDFFPSIGENGAWLYFTAVGIRDSRGSLIGALEMLEDITERKRAEEALMESQQKFSALFAANPEAAVFLDTDFRVIEANPRFSTLFGYSFDEIKGKVITDIIVPDDSKEESRIVREKTLSGPVEVVTRRKRKDGSLVPLFMSGGPVVVSDRVIGSVMVYKDISDIITVEEELGKALSRAELLNEKLSVVGGFVRHDVRNKLSAINGNVYLMRKRENGNVAIQNCLNQIKLSSDSIVRILDFARTFELLGNEKLVQVDVGAAVDQAVSLFADLKGVKIVNECKGFNVIADSMLTTIFHNLVDNSIKYGEKLTQIRVSDLNGADGSRGIIYEDNGVGIDAETKKRLFEKGFGKGTGLGLYLIKKAVDVYGWNIEETGLEGQGVRFMITIPKMSEKSEIKSQLQS
jgi:PAS domain S-box-containing protein